MKYSFNKDENKYKEVEKAVEKEEGLSAKDKEIEKEELKKIAKEVDKQEKKKPQINPIDDMSIPYPDKGGHTVSQLVGLAPHKRQSVLGEKTQEFEKKYLD
jgi:hypothetical protein